jgi:hypothetical protein
MKRVNHDPQTLTMGSFSTISAITRRLGKIWVFSKADAEFSPSYFRGALLLDVMRLFPSITSIFRDWFRDLE